MKTDADFMAAAAVVSEGSTDRSRKVGCVIVSQGGRILSSGANMFPHNVAGTEKRHTRPEKYFWTEHAERNAIFKAAKFGIPLNGSRIYIPWFPCMDCARAIVQSGIIEMIAVRPDYADPKWGEDFKRVDELFDEAGVSIRFQEASE